MSPEHIEFDQIHKEQSCKITLQPVQRSSHSILVRLRVITCGQTSPGEEIFNFADADHIFTGSLELIKQRNSQRSQRKVTPVFCTFKITRGANKWSSND